ncbi:MAG: hypothetical protein ACOC3G_06420, partial [Phycisphaeraceae bacterium]
DVCDVSCHRLGEENAAGSAGPTPGEGYADGAMAAEQTVDEGTSDLAESRDFATTEPSASPGWADTSSGGMLDIFA